MKEAEAHAVGYRTYIFVWLALLALTVITVTVSRLHLSAYAVLIAILIATAKSGLVLTYFMHMKYEPWILKMMLFFALLAMTLIILLTFTDVWYR